jgi:hypothetical protein
MLLAVACLAGGAGAASAQWPAANAGLVVCNASGAQNYRTAISDGAGGMFVAWSDTRFILSDIYVQHILSTGSAQWTLNGVLASSAPNRQDQPVLVSDGAGGIVVAWRDFRYDADGDIFAQRISPSGAPLWAYNGVPVCMSPGQQTTPVIAADSAGASPCGVVIAWEDDRGAPRIFAQRLTDSGEPVWDLNGRPVTTSLAAQYEPTIVTAGPFGTIVGWSQQGDLDYDVVAEFLGHEGQPLWDPAGAVVSGATGDQFHPAAVSDSAGGAWFAWEDARGASIGVYAQRLTLPGYSLLASGGVPVCGVDADQLSPVVVADGRGGVIVAWSDSRSHADVYSQRLDAGGVRRWSATGDPVCTASGGHYFPAIASDGQGGALVAWEDDRSGQGTDIYAQRVDSLGNSPWTAGGVGICTASGSQFQATLVSNPDSVGVVVWADLRGLNDLYCQRVPLQATPVRTPAPVVAAANSAPEQLSFAFSLPDAGRAGLTIVDTAGRRVRTLAHQALDAGAHDVPWDGRDDAGRACAEGVYVARLAVDGRAVATRSLTLRR